MILKQNHLRNINVVCILICLRLSYKSFHLNGILFITVFVTLSVLKWTKEKESVIINSMSSINPGIYYFKDFFEERRNRKEIVGNFLKCHIHQVDVGSFPQLSVWCVSVPTDRRALQEALIGRQLPVVCPWSWMT